MNICLILSAGTSIRFGGDLPKQYVLLNSAEVVSYSIDAMKRAKNTDAIICLANDGYVQCLCKKYDIEATTGGITRNRSLRNGIEYIKKNYPQCKKLFINEAARPFITSDLIDDYFCKLDMYDGVITTQHITDSLGRYGEAITERSEYYLVQAPEAFRFDLLYKHFKAESTITATGQQLPSESKIFLNFEFRHNMKITYPEDLVIAEAFMRYLYDKDSCI